MDDIKLLLAGIAGSLATLAIFAAAIIYGMNKIGEQQGGGLGEKALMGCVAAAIAFGAAAVYITAQDLSITF